MSLTITMTMPVLSAEKFAELTVQTVAAVNAQMDKRTLPVFQKAPRTKRYVNMIALAKRAEESANDDKEWNK